MKKCFFYIFYICISYFRHIYILFEKCENGDDIGDYFCYFNKYKTQNDKRIAPNNHFSMHRKHVMAHTQCANFNNNIYEEESLYYARKCT